MFFIEAKPRDSERIVNIYRHIAIHTDIKFKKYWYSNSYDKPQAKKSEAVELKQEQQEFWNTIQKNNKERHMIHQNSEIYQ